MKEGARTALTRSLSELAVIVVGVLMALAVDEWRDGLRQRDLESTYLRALAEDLRADSTTFADVYRPALAVKDSALRLIAPVVRGEPVRGDTFAFLSAVAQAGRLGSTSGNPLTRRTTFDELVATGNLAIIRSASLRLALVEHYARMNSESQRLIARIPDYPRAVHAYYPAELRASLTPADVRAFGLRRAVEGFRTPGFESVMNQELNYLYFVQAVIPELVGATNAMLRRVEAEATAH